LRRNIIIIEPLLNPVIVEPSLETNRLPTVFKHLFSSWPISLILQQGFFSKDQQRRSFLPLSVKNVSVAPVVANEFFRPAYSSNSSGGR
jgi:hypothetical protein